MEELKPCPFCGGDARYNRITYHTVIANESHIVFCAKCGASTQKYKTKQEAIAAWNKRAAETFNSEVMLMGDRVYLAGLGYFTKETTN